MTTKRFNSELKKLQAHRDKALKKAIKTPEEQEWLRAKRASISGAQQLLIVELLLELLRSEHPELQAEVEESLPILQIAETTLPAHIDALKDITGYMDEIRELHNQMEQIRKDL